jgi:hypothetical protein
MPRLLGRAEISEVLRLWERGGLSATEVHLWAEEQYGPGVEFEDREGADAYSVSLEVVARLDMLDQNLITPEDVPMYLEFLGTPLGEFQAGMERFEQALARIDYVGRRRTLRDMPPYHRVLQRGPIENRGA